MHTSETCLSYVHVINTFHTREFVGLIVQTDVSINAQIWNILNYLIYLNFVYVGNINSLICYYV